MNFSERHRNATERSDMWKGVLHPMDSGMQGSACPQHNRHRHALQQSTVEVWREICFSVLKLRGKRCFWKCVAPDSLDFSPCVFDCFGFVELAHSLKRLPTKVEGSSSEEEKARKTIAKPVVLSHHHT
jgi:hypothetical protein